MPQLIFHPDADAELIAAAQYYESQTTGLGGDFLQEINEALESIRQFPAAWPTIEPDIHRRLLKRFPFALIYRARLDHIRILAVAHLHREPGYWRKRLD